MDDDRGYDIVSSLLTSREQFFRNIRYFNYRQRGDITERFFVSEGRYLTMLNERRRARTQQTVNISIPFTFPASFLEAVPVLATPQQIADEVQNHTSSLQQTCSICQDSISSDGAILRVCRHVYHRSCIQTWFGASVRCPVCRRDIREDPADQTSSDATGMQPPQTSQWGGESSPQ